MANRYVGSSSDCRHADKRSAPTRCAKGLAYPRCQFYTGYIKNREQVWYLMAQHQSRICLGCWQQMHLPVPLRGVFSAPFRVFGIRPSRMNPNTCTSCELMFKTVMRARTVTIDATVLFADLRGYTSLSQTLSPDAISRVLDTFYDESASAIWDYDGLLNKTLGDAVMALFNFPIKCENHATHAVLAARGIQKRWRAKREKLVEEF